MQTATSQTLVVSIPSAPESWTTKTFNRLAEILRSSNTGLDVKVHDSAKLFKQGDEMKAMSEGKLDMATFSVQDVTELIPEFQFLTRGYLFNDYEHLERVYNGKLGNEVTAAISEKLKIQVLSIIYIGTRVLGVAYPKAVETPEDLRGVPLRMPAKESWQHLGRALGANPVPIAINNIVEEYANGKIEGQDSPLPALVSTQTDKYVKQVVLTNHMIDFLFVGISKAKWESLSNEQRTNLTAAAKVAKAFNDMQRRQEELALRQSMTKAFTTPNLVAFKTHAETYYQSELKKNPQDEEWKRLIEQAK